MKKLIISSIFMLMTFAGFAQTCGQQFVELDTNEDDYIDRDEATANAIVNNWFDDIDTNADGLISLAEFGDFCQ